MKRGLTLVAVAVMITVVASMVAGPIFQYLRRPVELKNWQVRTMIGVSLDSPGDFKERPTNLSAAPAMLEKVENLQCTFPGFEVVVSRVKYKPEAMPNLEGAAKGVVAGASRQEGMKSLTNTSKPVTISGKPAMRVNMRGERVLGGRSGTLQMRDLLITDDHLLYQVAVVFDNANPNAAEYAERLLKSVKLAP